MKLPTETRSLCSRIALERIRPAQWQAASELRKQAQAMLASGQPPMLVTAHLQALLGDALRDQAKTKREASARAGKG